MADPQDMTNEELDEAIQGAETPTEEVKTEEVKEEPSQEEQKEEEKPEEPAPQEPEEESAPPSRREQLRVQQLLKKYPHLNDKQPEKKDGVDYREVIEADDKLYDTLESDRQNAAEQARIEAMNEATSYSWRRFLAIEASQVESKYPQLDKASPDFHPAVADAMNTKYLRFIGYDPKTGVPANPDISYAEFVESEMEFADELAANRVARSTENIARQSAHTGLRPDGSAPKGFDLNKAPEDMTDEELEAAVSATMPRDSRGRFTKQ